MSSDHKSDIKLRMQKTLEKYKSDLSKIRTGRAHIGLLDHVQVDYYGSMMPISQVATLTVADARSIMVQAWEAKMIGVIEKAIRESDLGLNPVVNGTLIRIPLPVLTEERRKELIKVVKSEAELAKVSVRNIRRDANDVLKAQLKDKEITEDDEKRGVDDNQKMTDIFIAEIDKLTHEKEKELLTI